jgi:hypothetical protein
MRWLVAALLTRQNPGYEARHKARAEKKARTLLLGLLSDQQRREFQLHGFFYATGGSSGNRYRIRLDSVVNIDVLSKDGTVREYLCARPIGDIPMHDVMAAQLLYLQDPGSEMRFLNQANRHATLSFPGILASRNIEQQS